MKERRKVGKKVLQSLLCSSSQKWTHSKGPWYPSLYYWTTETNPENKMCPGISCWEKEQAEVWCHSDREPMNHKEISDNLPDHLAGHHTCTWAVNYLYAAPLLKLKSHLSTSTWTWTVTASLFPLWTHWMSILFLIFTFIFYRICILTQNIPGFREEKSSAAF